MHEPEKAEEIMKSKNTPQKICNCEVFSNMGKPSRECSTCGGIDPDDPRFLPTEEQVFKDAITTLVDDIHDTVLLAQFEDQLSDEDLEWAHKLMTDRVEKSILVHLLKKGKHNES